MHEDPDRVVILTRSTHKEPHPGPTKEQQTKQPAQDNK